MARWVLAGHEAAVTRLVAGDLLDQGRAADESDTILDRFDQRGLDWQRFRQHGLTVAADRPNGQHKLNVPAIDRASASTY